jgi:uncharacterized membrane protein YeaQ/YmgE (transglycosylase-associated protein family)
VVEYLIRVFHYVGFFSCGSAGKEKARCWRSAAVCCATSFDEHWRSIMAAFAQITLNPGGLFAWLVVGLIAGFLAGKVMRGAGYGLFVDIILGLVGAVVGGYLFGLIVAEEYKFWGSIVVAFLGACLIIFVARFLGMGRSRF